MGTTTKQTFPARAQLQLTRPDEAVLLPETIADGFACSQGDVMGKISSSKLVRRQARAIAAGGGFSTGSNTGTVGDDGMGKVDANPAARFAAGDALKLEDGTAIGTVDHVTLPATVVLTGNAAVAVAAGDAVLGSDGSEVAIGIANDSDDASGATPFAVFIIGILDPAKLRGLSAAAMQQMSGAIMAGPSFKF